MHIFLLILLAVLVTPCAANASNNTIEYKLKYSNSDHSCLDISFLSNIDQNGDYILQFPMGSGSFSIISITSREENPIKIIDTDNPFIKKLKGLPGSSIEIKYIFCLANEKKSIQWPIFEKEYFLFTFDKVLATPEHKPNDNWQIKVDLEDFPKEYKVYTSFSQDLKYISSEMLISKFKNSMVVGGNIYPHKLLINQKPVFLVILGEINSLQNPSFILENLLREQRAFWQDNHFENYLVVLHERPSNIIIVGASGIHPENGIIFQLTDFGKDLNFINIGHSASKNNKF